jgi:hypothetical protein
VGTNIFRITYFTFHLEKSSQLNVATVATFKAQIIATVATFKTQNIATLRKMLTYLATLRWWGRHRKRILSIALGAKRGGTWEQCSKKLFELTSI